MQRCRAIKEGNVVFCNSYGKLANGKAKKYSADGDSYDKEEKAVASSLTQRLSVLRTELWFAVEFGLPLLEKLKTKLEVDIAVAEIVEEHPDVVNISEFISEIRGNTYTCNLIINTKYGELELQI